MATEKRKIREQVAPKEGEYQFTYLAKYLGCSHARLRKLCEELGIGLKLGFRLYRYENGRKQMYRCRRKLRFLTQSEATRIMLLHREKAGAKALKRTQKERACP